MRKYFLIKNDLLLINLKLSWNDTITWREWEKWVINLILKAGFFTLKMYRMSESKPGRMKFQEQQEKTHKKGAPFKVLSEVNFIGWMVGPGKNRGVCINIYVFIKWKNWQSLTIVLLMKL